MSQQAEELAVQPHPGGPGRQVTVEAIVFDLDGVIIDSEPVWEEVRRRFVAERGRTWLPDSQQRLMGMSTAEWARYLAEDVGVPMPPDDVARAVIAGIVARYDTALPLIPGAVDAVRGLRDRWTLGLASSSPRTLIDAVLERAGMTEMFAVTVSTEEVPRGKPSPDVYLAVAARLHVDQAACVAVEDSSNGIRAAVAAGMRTVALARPEYPVDAGVLATASLALARIDQLTVEAIEGLA
jgi:HAD superfamily hydrolase (TIGR01509 family)